MGGCCLRNMLCGYVWWCLLSIHRFSRDCKDLLERHCLSICPRYIKGLRTEESAGAGYSTLISDTVNRWDGAPMASRKDSAAPQSCAAHRNKCLLDCMVVTDAPKAACATARSANPSRQMAMFILLPVSW